MNLMTQSRSFEKAGDRLLTDAFFRRYEDVQLWPAYTERERRFLGQVSQLITDEVHRRDQKSYQDREKDPGIVGLKAAHAAIARELGVQSLSPLYWFHDLTSNGSPRRQGVAYTIEQLTTNYLTERPGETNSPDLFIKYRVSLVEVAFQLRASQLRERRASLVSILDRDGSLRGEQLFEVMSPQHVWAGVKTKLVGDEALFKEQVFELNERFRQARMPLAYHNDLLQISDDTLIEQEIERPFWLLVSAPKWANVDQQLKEALDERDRGERNAVSNAMNALESAIKTISDDKGWTTGHEKGAANYIDNLVKERNGVRFIAVWEKDVLVKLFGDIRNLFGHGPAGGQALPTLLPQQTEWAIDTCMIWIKNLVRRA